MKLAIVGSRSFANYDTVKREVWTYFPKLEAYKDTIVSGGAVGVDKLAERFAKDHRLLLDVYLPDWKAHGKSAGFQRNQKIVATADAVIAFWDGVSKGTQHSFKLAAILGKPCIVVPV